MAGKKVPRPGKWEGPNHVPERVIVDVIGSGGDGSRIDHPSYYGGADNPYEAIKVIEAWSLGFCLGNAVKYIARAGKKVNLDLTHEIEDLEKARWYLDHQIQRLRDSK